jgi:competence protein ComEC
MSKGKLFFWSCLAFIGGIFIESFSGISGSLLPGFFILGTILFLGFWLDKRLMFVGILALSLALGLLRYQSEMAKISQSELRKLNDKDQNIALVGIVDDEPETKENSQQLRLKTSPGKILIITSKYPQYRYGDRLRVEGRLKTPENFERFDYQGYLQKEGIYSMAVFPKLELLETGQGNPVKQALFSFKNKFRQTWRMLLSPPQLGIFEALVFGEESNVPLAWKEKLNFSGTRHLTAVSGMNITIISFLLLQIFLFFGLWRQQAVWLALIFIWLYVLMIGLPSSALRASIMVSLVFIAQAFGRQASGERSLVFAAAILLFENPLLLKLDSGFQLSFLAMVGLIFWQPFLSEKVFRKLPGFLKTNLSTIFAAQIFTLPLLTYNFGYFSLVSPLSNILVAPVVSYLTMAGFVLGSLGIACFGLGRLFSLILWPFLTYILLAVDFSLKIPFNRIQAQSISGLFLWFSYFFLGWVTLKSRARLKTKIFQ